ncbi:MAG: 4Fe-4S ferredoxin, partial [Proteobacteria bacterium]|nr:4Fe-4S ferredoxin [Pseudomonadota bacterium]MBU1736878.1 4Fe-4S ferredoxin [Pseudomonadota bacterium]
MTDKLILKKDHLTPFLRKLNKKYRLIGPRTNRHGDTLFSPIDTVDSLSFDLDRQPQNSLKQFMFPQSEILFTYTVATPDKYEFKHTTNTLEPTVYFGVRSCDLSAILYMDVSFLQNTTDPHYLARRKNSVLIGLNCNNPFPNCFCNATKSG